MQQAAVRRSTSERPFDLIVVGGGLVGASFAAALAPTGLRIAILDADLPRPEADVRSTALAEGSRRILEGMGVWSAIRAAATPIRRIHISYRGRLGAARLDARELRVDALGHVVENRVLGPALWRAVTDAPQIETLAPASLVSVQQGPAHLRIELSAGDDQPEAVDATMVVAADGARSSARELLGIGVRRREYGQCAVVTTVTPARPHDSVAYERFTDDGPLAVLPLPNGQCSVVWTLSPDEAALIAALDERAFLARLQEAFGYRLGALLRASPRASFPLDLVEAHQQVADRCVLLGNAAHGLHPVAGQGFNLALRDAAVLAEVISDAVQAGADPGSAEVLERYSRWRAGDQRRVVFATDAIARLFASRFAPVRTLSQLGLLVLDFVPQAGAVLAHHAMGLSGRQSRLARGLPVAATPARD